MAKRIREKPLLPLVEGSQTLRTVDGRDVVAAGDVLKELAGRRVCAGGVGFGCHRHDPHPYAARTRYNDYSRNLKGIKLNAVEVDLVYFCRRCEKFQGCHLCVGDPASLVCTNCHDWANDISEKVHGRIVPRENASDVFHVVKVLARGKFSDDDAKKLFDDLFKPTSPTRMSGSG